MQINNLNYSFNLKPQNCVLELVEKLAAFFRKLIFTTELPFIFIGTVFLVIRVMSLHSYMERGM